MNKSRGERKEKEKGKKKEKKKKQQQKDREKEKRKARYGGSPHGITTTELPRLTDRKKSLAAPSHPYPTISHLRPFCHPEKGETQQTASEASEPSEAKPYKAILMLIACS